MKKFIIFYLLHFITILSTEAFLWNRYKNGKWKEKMHIRNDRCHTGATRTSREKIV